MKSTSKKTTVRDDPEKDSSYPVYDLAEALKIGEAVKELGGGRSPVAKGSLAKKLEYAESGPSFFQRVGAAKSFGVIEGWGEYSLTQRGKEYFYPTADGVKQTALIGFLRTPPLFNRITQKYDGDKLPDNATLGNVMHMEGVNDNWKERVAGNFVRSAHTAGAIDPSGFLRCAAGAAPAIVLPPVVDPPPPLNPRLPAPKGTKQFNFDFEGKTVSLTVSEDGLHLIQWQALNDYVQSLKPKEGKK
jgi:hypothetical protein